MARRGALDIITFKSPAARHCLQRTQRVHPSLPSLPPGLAHFGSNYTTLQFAPAIGSYLLATRLTGALYDAAAAAHGDPRDCIGPDCFRSAFLLLSAFAVAGAAACAAASARSRRVYAAVVRHMREAEEAEVRGSP
jgi:hypothetical protein